MSNRRAAKGVERGMWGDGKGEKGAGEREKGKKVTHQAKLLHAQ
jgi:hypothetical protein